jgi:sporulation protein YlmC with PRC-barrel domain
MLFTATTTELITEYTQQAFDAKAHAMNDLQTIRVIFDDGEKWGEITEVRLDNKHGLYFGITPYMTDGSLGSNLFWRQLTEFGIEVFEIPSEQISVAAMLGILHSRDKEK